MTLFFIYYIILLSNQEFYTMQIDISKIKTLRKRDVNSSTRYNFDEALEYVIKKHNKTKFDIISFTQNILNDFGLSHIQVTVSNKSYSYAGGNIPTIAYTKEDIDKGSIQTAIHEVSHIIAGLILDIPNPHFHDSFFASILKYLLIKYEILTLSQVNYAAEISHTKLSDSALIHFEITDHKSASYFIQSLNIKHDSHSICEYVVQSNKTKYRIIFSENNLAVITARKLYGFEITH